MLRFALLLAVFSSDVRLRGVEGFTPPLQELSLAIHHVTAPFQEMPTSEFLSSANPSSLTVVSSPPSIYEFGPSLFGKYKEILETYPLRTKMITGGLLAVVGDALGQAANNNDSSSSSSSSSSSQEYDTRRTVSFVAFDMAYRALQHWAFPAITATCQGQYMMALLSAAQLSSFASDNIDILAAIEQTMANQLGIVPFIYYPIFFSLTTIIQGVSMEEGFERAKTIFLPLMKRNLLFWVPVQFVQFRFIEESLQVPFVIVAGLVWTVILSVVAGSARGEVEEEEQQVQLQMAMESEFSIAEAELAEAEMKQKQLQEEESEVIVR